MLPLGVARVVIRKLLEQFDVGRKSHANMRSFDEIVTEQPLLRETPGQYFVEGLDVVDRFPVIDRVAEHVLIEVGDRLAIGIASPRIRKQPRETRCRCRWKRDTDARLNDRVTANTVTSVGRELNAIERVRDRLNQLARRPVWKLGVGIERNYIANSRRQRSCVHEDAGFLAIQ